MANAYKSPTQMIPDSNPHETRQKLYENYRDENKKLKESDFYKGYDETLNTSYANYIQENVENRHASIRSIDSSSFAPDDGMQNTNPLSYGTIVNQMNLFKRKDNGILAALDTPGYYFFKILFHFNNGIEGTLSSNLLGCDWLTSEILKKDLAEDTDERGVDEKNPGYVFSNTAFNFLMINDELERAAMLMKFITLLSDINSDCPWYWQSISGLENALDRKHLTDASLKIEDRKELTIKCLPDAYDDRVGTLLDLYRAAAYSYQLKKEIIPANLRKFDMSVYIFNTPILNMHNKLAYKNKDGQDINEDWAELKYFNSGQKNINKRASAKCLEFRNCEIDYNSITTGFGEISNAEGKQIEYTIKLKYDDCFENRYNEVYGYDIGDYVAMDFVNRLGEAISTTNNDPEAKSEQIQATKTRMGILDNAVINFNTNGAPTSPTLRSRIPGSMSEADLHSHNPQNPNMGKLYEEPSDLLAEDMPDPLKKYYLGNFYGFSLGTIGKQAKGWLQNLPGMNIINNLGTVDGLVDLAQDIVHKATHKPSSDMVPLSMFHRKKLPGYGPAEQLKGKALKDALKQQAISDAKSAFFNL